MAKVVITFIDNLAGGVKVESVPSFDTMMKIKNSGHDLSVAQSYALNALTAVIRAADEQKKRMKNG